MKNKRLRVFVLKGLVEKNLSFKMYDKTNIKRQFNEILGEQSDDIHIWKNIDN